MDQDDSFFSSFAQALHESMQSFSYTDAEVVNTLETDLSSQTKVVVRQRPLLPIEKGRIGSSLQTSIYEAYEFQCASTISEGGTNYVHIRHEENIRGSLTGAIQHKIYNYPYVYNKSSTSTLYEDNVKEYMNSLFETAHGNLLCICCGQTSSGKTFTSTELCHLVLTELCQLQERNVESREVFLSFFELCGDECVDLLPETIRQSHSPSFCCDGPYLSQFSSTELSSESGTNRNYSKTNIKVFENTNGKIWTSSMKEKITSTKDALKLLNACFSLRYDR